MSHGGVEQGQLLLVVTQVGASGGGFDHADEKIWGWGGEEGVAGDKLVSKDPD